MTFLFCFSLLVASWVNVSVILGIKRCHHRIVCGWRSGITSAGTRPICRYWRGRSSPPKYIGYLVFNLEASTSKAANKVHGNLFFCGSWGSISRSIRDGYIHTRAHAL
ncbi:hypothetical protein CI102_7324 [Trichoderma harzianum]|nr:hypothetical protein CI102_7324 [Trichoderma harzianum]